MLMKNTATTAIKVPADVIDPDSWDDGARPTGKVTIPAGAVVNIRDEYAVRSRVSWSRDKEVDEAAPSTIEPVISQLAPQLKPEGEAAVKMLAEVFHDQLPSVRRAYEELARTGKAERGEVSPSEARPRFH